MPDLSSVNLVIDPNTGEPVPPFAVISNFAVILPNIQAISPGESGWIDAGVGFDIGGSLGVPPLHNGPLIPGFRFSLMCQSPIVSTTTNALVVVQYRLAGDVSGDVYAQSNSTWFSSVALLEELIPFCALPIFTVPSGAIDNLLRLQINVSYVSGTGNVLAGNNSYMSLAYIGFQQAAF